MKTFAVIGLGRFGTAIALELARQGQEVLCISKGEEEVQAVSEYVTHAVCADATDMNVLKELSVKNCDCAVVAIAGDVGVSALITMTLKELGVKRVICKARSHVHRRVLEKIGADRVVFPEFEMGEKLAKSLSAEGVAGDAP